MAKRDILKEAIADAKAVKEVAIENAKAALEESFTPHLKSMLAAKIQEMDEDDDKMEEMLDMDPDMREPADDEYAPARDTVDRTMMETEDMDEEIDLDEILAELEGETLNEESEAERADVDKYEYEEGKEEGEEEMDDAESVDIEDMTDDDLKTFIEDVIADMVSSGELEAGDNFEEEDEDTDVEIVDDETEEVEVDSEEVELDEVMTSRADQGAAAGVAELVKMVGKLKDVPAELKDKFQKWVDTLEKDPKHKYKSGKYATVTKESEEIAENKKLRRELKEAYATVKTQKSTLNEVRLLNAKLLYTNKIFKAKSLTENEKVKVLSSFDKATTIKESKLIFETLSEGLKSKRTPIKESLGRASKSTGNFKSNKKPIIATDPMVSRFQKLAGLK